MTFGLVHLSTLRDDLYQLNNAGTALVGRRSKRRLELGQKISVVTERVDRFKRQIDFRLNG
jgi:ribonuclease R